MTRYVFSSSIQASVENHSINYCNVPILQRSISVFLTYCTETVKQEYVTSSYFMKILKTNLKLKLKLAVKTASHKYEGRSQIRYKTASFC